MKITLNISDELIEKSKGDLTITLNYEKSVKSPSIQYSEQTESNEQTFKSGTPSNSNGGLSFNFLNKLLG
jgi:hypothetical protein